MPRRRVYLDAGILILASRAVDHGVGSELTKRALEELNQSDVDFLYSRIIELETLPQPTVNKFPNQVGFLKEYFRNSELDRIRTCMGAVEATHRRGPSPLCIPIPPRPQRLPLSQFCDGGKYIALLEPIANLV